MSQAQVLAKPLKRKRTNEQKHSHLHLNQTSANVDAATLASAIQKEEENREFLYSLIALIMKIGLLALFSASFVKLTIASHQRVRRQIELSSILDLESERLNRLNRRFDKLFTIGGEGRFMSEQDHWIAPNSFRVIWR